MFEGVGMSPGSPTTVKNTGLCLCNIYNLVIQKPSKKEMFSASSESSLH